MNISECDEVEPGLYIGNLQAARDEKILKENNITHVLCAFIYPVEYPKDIKSMFIDVEDSENETIITYFDQTNPFIEEGQKAGGCLVHCFAGVSRSSTLVIAFLMQKHKINFPEAFARVKKKHCWTSPNFGFRAQLELYETMKYKLDSNNHQYKLLMLQHLRNKVISTQDFSGIAAYCSVLSPKTHGDHFKCKRCRKYLFSEANLLYHSRGHPLDWKYHRLEKNDETCIQSEIMFIELLEWMSGQVTSLSGEILCPKCRSNIGNFSWSSDRVAMLNEPYSLVSIKELRWFLTWAVLLSWIGSNMYLRTQLKQISNN